MMGFVGNYLRNLARQSLGAEPKHPLLFSWYVTHRCDLNCRYCCDGDGKRFKADPVAELDVEEARRLLVVLREAGDTLDVTGGEPLVRTDLEEILAEARKLGFRTVLNTKGIGIEARPDLLRFTDVLVLSLDTLKPDSLSEVIGRPVETAARILDALRFALEARREKPFRLVLSAVATPDNTPEVREVMSFALENALGFQVSPEILGTRVNPALLRHGEYRKLLDDVLAAKRRVRGVLGVPEYLVGIRDFGRFRCRPLLMPVIRPDGKMIYPCVEKKDALVDLIQAGSYAGALREARRRAGPIPRCEDCCHIFCHMALSLLQAHPLSALGELKHWRN
jgi:MoaA/NifB/PqqE/SkfB family radical SAM enzyme